MQRQLTSEGEYLFIRKSTNVFLMMGTIKIWRPQIEYAGTRTFSAVLFVCQCWLSTWQGLESPVWPASRHACEGSSRFWHTIPMFRRTPGTGHLAYIKRTKSWETVFIALCSLTMDSEWPRCLPSTLTSTSSLPWWTSLQFLSQINLPHLHSSIKVFCHDNKISYWVIPGLW